MDVFPPKPAIRFRYNWAFLPEYVSTVAISIAVSAVFLTRPFGKVDWSSSHTLAGIVLYTMSAALLVGITIRSRIRYGVVRLEASEPNSPLMYVGSRLIEVNRIDRISESLTRFYGRRCRALRIEDASGWHATITEALARYDDLRKVLDDVAGPITITHSETEAAERARDEWQERHDMFPPPRDLSEVFNRGGWRFVCLLPVCVFDVAITAAVILLLKQLDQTDLVAYSAPISLLTSGFVARFVYYYMFTSTAMNHPIGT